MLSTEVLEELTRRSPLQEHLVAAAWADLTTESKLQLIQALGAASHAEAWLARLALNDAAPIIRFWGARHAYFVDPEQFAQVQKSGGLWFGSEPTEEDAADLRKAKEDPEPLVRAVVTKGIPYTALTALSQFERLVFIRGLTSPHLGGFCEWLNQAIEGGVSDADLAACATEFMSLPATKFSLSSGRAAYFDGLDAYVAGNGLKSAWAAVEKGGPRLRQSLVFVLPTALGLFTMDTANFAALPVDAQKSLLYRSDESREIKRWLAAVKAQPEKFPVELVEALKRLEDEPLPKSDETLAKERERRQEQETWEQGQALKDGLQAMRYELEILNDQMRAVRTALGQKRGLFG